MPPLAADVGHLRSEALPHGFDVVLVPDTRQQAQQRHDVASLGLNLRNLRRGQKAGVVAVARFHLRAPRFDRDYFRQVADVELDLAEIELPAGAEDVVAFFERAEPRELHLDGIAAGHDGAERELSASIGESRAARAGTLVRQCDRRAGNRRTLRVENRSRDSARVLRPHRRRDEPQKQRAGEQISAPSSCLCHNVPSSNVLQKMPDG